MNGMEAMYMNIEMKAIPIEVRDVSKSFQMGTLTIPVLNRISLKISEGEFISVMGASGSGKSTLLYLMGGLDRASEGTVLLNGFDLSVMSDREQSRLRRQKLGFVFQFYNLVPNMNVEENILLPILLDGKSASSYREKLDDVLGLTGLLHRRKNTPARLSGGEQLEALALEDRATGRWQELPCQGLFAAIGRIPETALLQGQVKLDSQGYVLAGESTQTNLPGVYAAGDIRTKPLRQIVTAASDGAE